MAKIDENPLKSIIAHTKEYGFIFPSSEIYDGLSATYDYGQQGAALKNNLKQYWWKAMVQMHDNIVGIDAAIFMHPTTWKASGHVDAFNDPLVDNKDSKKRYRADVLIEDAMSKIEAKIEKEVEKASERFGATFDREQFVNTHPRVKEYTAQLAGYHDRFKRALNLGDMAELKQLIIDMEVACPVSGTRNWTDVRQFNLMFSTDLGSVADESQKIYLRPETAQGIFVNYLNVQKTGRMKLPFGIAQIGKAFRNEIIARQFIFRMREFEQMEMQFFIKPGEELTWYEYWKEKRMRWHKALGLGDDKYRFFDHINLAHYANAAADIQFEFPIGFKELEGIHSRTDFDLKSHEQYSGKKLQYFDTNDNQSYVPYVVETSVGLDRLFLAVTASTLKEETLTDGSTRTVMALPPAMAPNKAAILPLIPKDGLSEMAEKLANELRVDFQIQYEEKDTIGKRYRRQDAIGTPFCITIDHESLSDQAATVRYRDSMQQERISLQHIHSFLTENTGMSQLLKQL